MGHVESLKGPRVKCEKLLGDCQIAIMYAACDSVFHNRCCLRKIITRHQVLSMADLKMTALLFSLAYSTTISSHCLIRLIFASV
jgi:hypothetical protein